MEFMCICESEMYLNILLDKNGFVNVYKKRNLLFYIDVDKGHLRLFGKAG